MTDYSPQHPSFICAPATLSNPESRKAIENWLTSLRQDSLVNPSARQGNEREETTNEMDGLTPLQSFASFDQGSFSWRMYQLSFLQDTSALSSVTWPRAGMIAAGIAFQHRPLAPIIKGIGSGLSVGTPTSAMSRNSRRSTKQAQGKLPTPVEIVTYPTPTTNDVRQRFNTSQGSTNHRPNLGAMAKFNLWPTPTQCDANGTGHHNPKGGQNLRTAVQTFPTPTSSDATKWNNLTEIERRKKGHSVRLCNRIESGGKLNPRWVEWLMSWPIGWASLEPLEMARFRQWLAKFGDC